MPPANLAVCRVLFFLGILLFYVPHDLAEWSTVPHSYWKPTWLFSTFRLPLLTVDRMQIVALIWKLAVIGSFVGFLTRMSTLVAFVLGVYVLGLPSNFGKVGHGEPVLIFTMLILAVSRCGDALSVDAMIRSWRGKPAPPASGEYTWPIRAAWILLSIIFAAAGATKLIRSGFAWITSDNLQLLLLQHHYRAQAASDDAGPDAGAARAAV